MYGISKRLFLANSVSVSAFFFATAVSAQEGPSYTVFGTPGLLEMPTAESADPSDIAATIAYSKTGGYRTSFSYQLTPKLSGSFRYAVFDMYGDSLDDEHFETFDRSFDLHYRFNEESQYIPAFAVGLRDFLGTGRFGSEYVVASKSFGPNLVVSGGLGWGRMGTKNGFSNPLGVVSSYFEDRPVYEDRSEDGEGGTGGQISVKQFFRGDAALFGGLEYQISPDLGFKAEYSSNAYLAVPLTPAIDISSPLNFGVTYRPNPSVELNAGYLYGTTLSLGVTMLLNPEERPTLSGLETAPAPVKVRPQDALAATTWDRANEPAVRAGLAQLLAIEGISLNALEVGDRVARVRYRNDKYRSEAQAMGRVSRMMSQIMPASVETFVLEPMQRGIALSATTLQRRDLEQLENTVGASEALLTRAQIGSAGSDDGLVEFVPTETSKWEWGIGPYTSILLFAADSPVTADVGLQFDGRYEISENLVFSGSVRQTVLGQQDPAYFFNNENDYENVRTDGAYFGRDGGPNLTKLSLAHYGKVAPDIYSRVTLGYLEYMHAGVSAELLWKPVGTRWAVGGEVNHTAMRNRDMGFGIDEYDYQITTGHLSGYYDFGKGFQAQLDVGRYLAGDWGATFALDREFANGWKIGGYFTLTDMPFDQFGEGAFDKGIKLTIPFDYFVGSPSRKEVNTTLQSLSRDGGARLLVDGRLYETVRDGHMADITDTWGRFWR